MASVTPWWSHRYELCRATKQECHYKEVCHRECFYEVGEDGTPRRKCVSNMQLLELCPGRNQWESITSRDLQETEQGPSVQHSSQHTSGEQSQAAQHVPVQPEVGEQWEEFLRYALEMQRQLAKETGVTLEPEPSLPRQRVMDVPVPNKSVLQRLFRREPPVTGTKYNFAKLWKDYAAYGSIEEV